MLRGLALDLVAWWAMPAVFLYLYLTRYLAPADAVAPHLRAVLLPLAAVQLLRLLLGAARMRPAPARLAVASIAGLLLSVMLAYYALVLTGLDAWGRVVSWDLITSYARQAPELGDALGVSPALALAAAAGVYAAFAGVAWFHLRRFNWVPAALALCPSRWPVPLALCAGAAVVAIELHEFVVGPPIAQFEPFSLTFYPTRAAWNFQGLSVDRLRMVQLDAAEEAARAAYVPATRQERRNLVLIVVDALRPDHMGVYGYARDTTPNLSRLERAGRLRKAQIHAACSSSFCGLLSIASSKFLHQFSERPITLQEALRRNGYRVHMLLGGNHTLFYGLRKVYGEVDTYFETGELRSMRYMNDDRAVLDRLDAFPDSDGVPVMFQFHLMSAHVLGNRDPALARYAPAANYGFAPNRDPGEQPAERTVNFYDNGVLQADAVIGALLETLARKGYLQDAVVAITADHGEGLGENGLFMHANSVREEVLRVPFLLLSYGGRATSPLSADHRGSHVDIAPTLLGELGIPRPSTWTGMALQQPQTRDFLYFRERSEAGLIDLREPATVWKYWLDARSGREYAFNLSTDPGERTNAIADAPLQRRREWRLRVLAAASIGTSVDLADPRP